jgi:ATPase subunit of ABC transporter with duplicated ATPase domains
MKGPRDHDARSAIAKGRAASGEARAGRAVSIARAEAERADVCLTELGSRREVGRSVFVHWEPSPRARVLALDAAEVRAGPRVVLSDVHVAVGRADRVRVEGPNGAGKTTLLRALVATSSLPAERVLYVPQEMDDGAAHLEELRAMAPDARGRVLSLVAALGVRPEHLLASRRPSPGEAKKLALAMGLGQHVWALLLDEPTNHLDLPSIERLEDALARFPGALVLVTHDDALARASTRTTWRIQDGALLVT